MPDHLVMKLRALVRMTMLKQNTVAYYWVKKRRKVHETPYQIQFSMAILLWVVNLIARTPSPRLYQNQLLNLSMWRRANHIHHHVSVHEAYFVMITLS